MKKQIDLYEIYSRKYDANVQKIERYSPSEAATFREIKMSRAEFNGSYDDYRSLLIQKQPTTRPSREDVANWIANQETKEKSYKSAMAIKKTASKLGYNLSFNEIQFGTPETSKELKEFWDEVERLRKSGTVDMSTVWGSP